MGEIGDIKMKEIKLDEGKIKEALNEFGLSTKRVKLLAKHLMAYDLFDTTKNKKEIITKEINEVIGGTKK